MKLSALQCLVVMFLLLAKNTVSAVEVDASCVIPPNTYAFVSIDDGMMGRLSSVCGLQPIRLFHNKTNENYFLFIRYITLEDKSKAFKISWSSDDKLSEDDGYKISPYDIDSRVKDLNKERKYDALNASNVGLNKVTCFSMPFSVVEKEIYSVNVYQSKSLDEIKKLPVSALYFAYNWQVCELE